MERKEKLVVVTNKEIIPDLRDLNDVRLVYPLESFCIGYPYEFSITKIDDYALINRLLTDQDLKKLKKILAQSKIKGLIFDDLGIIELVKDLDVEKILLLNHLGNNYRSINYYLDYVDSIITSSDITIMELNYLLEMSKKPLILNTFGLIPLMYSRRALLTNYSKHNNLKYAEVLDTTINDKEFKFWENPYGTVVYTQKYYFLENYADFPNVLAYYYNPVFLSKDEILNVLKDNLDKINTFDFLQNEKTYFKLKGGENND